MGLERGFDASFRHAAAGGRIPRFCLRCAGSWCVARKAVGALFVFTYLGLGPDGSDDVHPLPLRLSRTQAGIGGHSPGMSSIAGVTYPRLLGILALCLDYIVG